MSLRSSPRRAPMKIANARPSALRLHAWRFTGLRGPRAQLGQAALDSRLRGNERPTAVIACLVSVSLSRENGPMLRRFLLIALLTLATAPARAEVGVAPFDASLQRLAEILGALHYLRSICGANEGQKWRNEMQAI